MTDVLRNVQGPITQLALHPPVQAWIAFHLGRHMKGLDWLVSGSTLQAMLCALPCHASSSPSILGCSTLDHLGCAAGMLVACVQLLVLVTGLHGEAHSTYINLHTAVRCCHAQTRP